MISVGVEHKVTIEKLIVKCVEEAYPFVIFRYPNTETFYFLLSKKREAVKQKIDFEECPAGFVVAPFHSTVDLPYLYAADIFFEITDKIDSETVEKLSEFLDFKENPLYEKLYIKENFEEKPEVRNTYLEKVSSIVEILKETTTNKVVFSRFNKIGKLGGNDYFSALKHLSQKHPSAFINFINLPWKNQIWIGASPETLVHQNPEGKFSTVALAGTQPSVDSEGNEIPTANALWSQKEIEEQALVSRYIINCLKKIRVREYEEKGPRSVKAGNLIHLCSTYTIDSKSINFPNLSSVMLDLLHPTSAVCGMPKQEALEILDQLEGYDRELYSGYIGPINIQNDSHLFVNIRSLKIENDEITLFSGGGITADSSPEKEWIETEIKQKSIRAIFE
jgi:isochorismate synthase